MWTILIPFLSLHLHGKTTRKIALLSLAQLSSFALLSNFFPYPLKLTLYLPFALYQWIYWVLSVHFQLTPSWRLLYFLKSPKSFFDSLPFLGFTPYIISGGVSIACGCIGLHFHAHIPTWLILLSLSSSSLFFLKTPLHKKTLPAFKFPYERSIFLSSDYPALRTTLSFLGEKKIEIPISSQEKPHIIFLFLESFRAKNVGALGSPLPASPHFDAWSKKGILFQNFYTTGQQTFRALLSSYFGIPAHLDSPTLNPFCKIPMLGLPEILKTEGYIPAVIQSGHISFDSLYLFFKTHGFSTILGAEHLPIPSFNSWGVDDFEMLKYSANWLQQQKTPTFLSLFTINNHHPWQLPRNWHFPVDPTLPLHYQQFLQTFSYTDHCLGAFLQDLEQKDLLRKSILFIMGDHGQNTGDDPVLRDINQGLLQEQIHVPFLLLAEGRNVTPSLQEKSANFSDFLPTILDLFNSQAPHHSLGKSLLRDHKSPVYFSLHRQGTHIGAIIDGKQHIVTENHADLADCKTFFHNVDVLYKKKAWAPRSLNTTHCQVKALPSMRDTEWITHLKKHPPSPSIHIAKAERLTDAAFLQSPPEIAKHWQQILASNCTLLTDQTLIWIAEHCKELLGLDISNCPLLTDFGIKTVLTNCLKLAHLYIDGITDLTSCIPLNSPLYLCTCSLLDLPNLQFEALHSLFRNAKGLQEWSASIALMTSQEMLHLAQIPKITMGMHLTQGEHISDEAMNALLNAQPQLQQVRLDDFPHLEYLDFSKLTKLRSLRLQNVPNLNKASLKTLEHLPLSFCSINGKLYQSQ